MSDGGREGLREGLREEGSGVSEGGYQQLGWPSL